MVELICVPDQFQLEQQQEEPSRAAEDGKAWLCCLFRLHAAVAGVPVQLAQFRLLQTRCLLI